MLAHHEAIIGNNLYVWQRNHLLKILLNIPENIQNIIAIKIKNNGRNKIGKINFIRFYKIPLLILIITYVNKFSAIFYKI